MNAGNRPSEDALIAAVEQNFQTARYAERNIQLFAGGYLAIFGGAFVAASRDWTGHPTYRIPLLDVELVIVPAFILTLIMLVSLTGMVLTFKFAMSLYYYSKYARTICEKELHLEGKIAPALRNHVEEKIRTPLYLNASSWILGIYIVIFCCSSGLLLYAISHNRWISMSVAAILLVLTVRVFKARHDSYTEGYDEYIARKFSDSGASQRRLAEYSRGQ